MRQGGTHHDDGVGDAGLGEPGAGALRGRPQVPQEARDQAVRVRQPRRRNLHACHAELARAPERPGAWGPPSTVLRTRRLRVGLATSVCAAHQGRRRALEEARRRCKRMANQLQLDATLRRPDAAGAPWPACLTNSDFLRAVTRRAASEPTRRAAAPAPPRGRVRSARPRLAGAGVLCGASQAAPASTGCHWMSRPAALRLRFNAWRAALGQTVARESRSDAARGASRVAIETDRPAGPASARRFASPSRNSVVGGAAGELC